MTDPPLADFKLQCSALATFSKAKGLPVIFWQKLTHAAARFLCDSWATCSGMATGWAWHDMIFLYLMDGF